MIPALALTRRMAETPVVYFRKLQQILVHPSTIFVIRPLSFTVFVIK